MDFIGLMKNNMRRIFIVVSVDRYSRWPTASICKYTDGKIAVSFLKQYIPLNGIPKIFRTDKGTAFMGNTFRSFCKEMNIKLVNGTPYIHSSTGLVERGIKTLKDSLRTNLEDGCKVEEALDRSLMAMRTTFHT